MVLGAAGMAAQLDLDCAAPERARALIDYARLSDIEQLEDNQREALDKALARCPGGAEREACRSERRRQALLDWDRKLAGIKVRYEKMHKDFEERCRASIGQAPEASTGESWRSGGGRSGREEGADGDPSSRPALSD